MVREEGTHRPRGHRAAEREYRSKVRWRVLLLFCAVLGAWAGFRGASHASRKRVVTGKARLADHPPFQSAPVVLATQGAPQPMAEDVPLSFETYYLSWGETISGLLLRQGLEAQFAFDVVHRLEESEVNVSQWRTNDPIALLRDASGELKGLSFSMLTAQVSVSWKDGVITLENHYQSPRRVARAHSVTINTSLFVDGEAAGIDTGVLMEVLGIYSFDLDLQRDIQPGNRFEVLYYVLTDEEGKTLRYDDIVYTSLETGDGRVYSYFLFDGLAEERGYYSADGRSVRKALMKTPINGAYISSGYGYRNNPTRRGYSDYHTGIDFAAPPGTPIYAAGAGRITVRGWSRAGYGRYIMVDHPNGYRTLYGHMSAFRSGLTVGSRVEQGEVIGYVGSTGNSTGPHLHYEIYRRGSTINPLHLNSPPNRQLSDDDLNLLHKGIQAQLSSMGDSLSLVDQKAFSAKFAAD